MIKVHHARRARSARVLWLLEELGVPYEVQPLEFSPAALQTPEYLQLHPLGLVPVIEEGGMRMFESGAILEYLLERHGNGRLAPPPGSPARPAYLQWFHYGEATLARYISDIVRSRFGMPESVRCAEYTPFARGRYKSALAPVNEVLGKQEYIAGAEFTAADIMVSYGIVMGKITGELPAEFANLPAYLGRLKARSAYAKAWA
jgi:glutathione S-transferase